MTEIQNKKPSKTNLEEPNMKSSVLYRIARVIAAILFNTLCPIKYYNKQAFDREAPYIIICNHNSWIDPVCIAYALKKYEIVFLGKKELMKNKLVAKALHSMHAIAVDRNHSDMGAIRTCLKVLKDGGVLGIFPEGTRHKKGIMEELEGGVGLLALRSKAPVVPVYINNKIKPFSKTRCYIGEPMPIDDLTEAGISKETTQAFLERITQTYQKMVEQDIQNNKTRKK